nr:hypothetical protein [Tanacetum cinerariifolium]
CAVYDKPNAPYTDENKTNVPYVVNPDPNAPFVVFITTKRIPWCFHKTQRTHVKMATWVGGCGGGCATVRMVGVVRGVGDGDDGGGSGNGVVVAGHMARQCTQPKRSRNSAWFKKKMLVQAQEDGQVLDEEQFPFLSDLGIPYGQVIQTTISQNVAFQTDDLDVTPQNLFLKIFLFVSAGSKKERKERETRVLDDLVMD